MSHGASALTVSMALVLASSGVAADPPAKPSPREALQPFNDLIGTWKAIGTPEGTVAEKNKGLWQETVAWEWQFKDGEAWLKVTFDKGKHFTDGTLRPLPGKDQFQLTLATTDRQTLTFTGSFKDHKLIAERVDDRTKESHRVVVSLLDDNRFLYHHEVRKENQQSWQRLYRVGATKVGKPLVAVSDEIGPLCVVSYGPPLSEITYKGKTYYVCCSSCRAEFRESPEKYIKEYEEHLAMLARKKAEGGGK